MALYGCINLIMGAGVCVRNNEEQRNTVALNSPKYHNQPLNKLLRGNYKRTAQPLLTREMLLPGLSQVTQLVGQVWELRELLHS